MGYNLPSWACNLLLIGFKFPGGGGQGEMLAIEKREDKTILIGVQPGQNFVDLIVACLVLSIFFCVSVTLSL